MQRTCRYVPLSKQPLVLALCQVKFSPVRKMAEYIPAIQEDFRREGYPLESAGKMQQIAITPAGIQNAELLRWEYRTRDERRSIVVTEDSVALQTTSYQRFEDFADQLRMALSTVLTKTEHDKLGLVQRIGLRYVDVVQHEPDKDYRFYLRPGLHGIADQVFSPPGSNRLRAECVGATDVAGTPGAMLVRIVQNDQGADLPPDLAGGAPKHESKARRGELVTLIDIDHFLQGTFDPDVNWVLEKLYKLHDHLIETFHEHVVTPGAVEAWK